MTLNSFKLVLSTSLKTLFIENITHDQSKYWLPSKEEKITDTRQVKTVKLVSLIVTLCKKKFANLYNSLQLQEYIKHSAVLKNRLL